jgi:iron complex transport system ATP-binding protein
MLTTSSLAIGYKTPLASDLDLELRPAELACLIGPNGVGKSTLLRTLAGMQKPLAGAVWLDGENLYTLPSLELAKRLAVVLTGRVDAGNLSAWALVSLGRHPYTDWLGRLTVGDEAAIERAMRLTDTLVFAGRPIHELSDGERQRVMIARALAQILPASHLPPGEGLGVRAKAKLPIPNYQPPNVPTLQRSNVLLLDEPTAFLDLPRRVDMLQLLKRLARETSCAILLSTHDLDLALRIADRLWLLSSSGELTTGIPEELALNGAVARLFQSEGVDFDHASGAFKVHQPSCGPISLHGDKDGVTLAWTWRALERLGYEVYNNGTRQPVHVDVLDAARWHLTIPKGQSEHHTLESLLTALQPRDT